MIITIKHLPYHRAHARKIGLRLRSIGGERLLHLLP